MNFLLPHQDAFLYIFLFISAVVENLFPPVPGDTITALGAFLVGTGRLNFFLVYLVTTAGSVTGFMFLFFLGRFLEREFFLERDYRFFSKESILKAENWFGRYGYRVVLANRFLPGIRSVISLVSGISLLGPAKVTLYATISAMIWNLLWIQAGFLLGNNWEIVRIKTESLLRTYNISAGIILAGAIVAFFIVQKWKSRKKKNDH